MKKLREDYIEIEGGEIPVTLLKKDDKIFNIEIDSVLWVETESEVHAVVLYEMIKDNIIKYMNYEL